VIPKFPSTLSLFQTLPEQFAVVQNALEAIVVAPLLFGKAVPTPKPGST
jgi:hypothetical protein